MGVGREDDRVGHAGAELRGDFALSFGPNLAHDLVPFAVGEPRGVLPRLELSVVAGVGPQMMTVRREMQALGIGVQALAEQRLETQRSVLSDHNSGKMRLSSVE